MGKLFHDINVRLTDIYAREEAQAVALLLLEKTTGLCRADVLMGKDDGLLEETRLMLRPLVERLLQHEPVQYVMGEADFCGMSLKVTPSVLVPRQETEELVDVVMSLMEHYIGGQDEGQGDVQRDAVHLLDIGTGSGCIALALKKRLPRAEVTAVDKSAEALEVAKENAVRVHADVDFHLEDILTAQPHSGEYDAIVSNPPYVCDREKTEMDTNVLDFEPHTALFVPNDRPLLFYDRIIWYAQSALKVGGLLAFEVNRLYGADVAQAMTGGGFTGVTVRKDMYGNDRIVTGWRQGKR